MGTTSRQGGRFRWAIGASALALAAASGATQALAATPKDKDKDSSTVSEVVVTAQFRQQNLQKTPLAITAVNGAMMDARAQTRITDVAAQAPNVQLEPNPAGGGNSMKAYIRGVGQSDQDPALDPGVGIYVDDVNFGTVTGQIWSRRLELAAADLVDPRHQSQTVSQIAFGAGFEDAAHFSRAFKVRFGHTPRDWRLLGLAKSH